MCKLIECHRCHLTTIDKCGRHGGSHINPGEYFKNHQLHQICSCRKDLYDKIKWFIATPEDKIQLEIEKKIFEKKCRPYLLKQLQADRQELDIKIEQLTIQIEKDLMEI